MGVLVSTEIRPHLTHFSFRKHCLEISVNTEENGLGEIAISHPNHWEAEWHVATKFNFDSEKDCKLLVLAALKAAAPFASKLDKFGLSKEDVDEEMVALLDAIHEVV